MNKNKRKRNIIILFALIILTVYITWQNNDIVVSNFDVGNTDIPQAFHNKTILHISDLHNKSFGRNQKRLISHTKAINPDIIVITGDLIDRKTKNIGNSIDFVCEAIKIAPIYYVTGNHEHSNLRYDVLMAALVNVGVIVLENKSIQWTIDSEEINIIGINDFSFFSDTEKMSSNIEGLRKIDQYNILLSHRPELIDIYSRLEIDLVLAGHTHGGQIRLPFIGGLVAPDQGFFPKYTDGFYTVEDTTMIVSRGLGNSIIPIRTFNRPELVVIKLVNDSK